MYPMKGDKTWIGALNNRLLKKINSSRDGQINQDEFADHYMRLFESQLDHHFTMWMEQFHIVVQTRLSNFGTSSEPSSNTQRHAVNPPPNLNLNLNLNPNSNTQQRSSAVLSRQQQLQSLFEKMDLDVSGFIEADEVSELAQMRRALYPMKGDRAWTDDLNHRLLKVIDTNGDGQINETEFVRHYHRLFKTQEDHVFNTWVEQFQFVVQKLHRYTPKSSPPNSKAKSMSQPGSPRAATIRQQVDQLMASVQVTLL